MPTCTTASLITNFPSFSGFVLSDKKRMALKLWFMLNELSTNGGTNYLSTIQTTLLNDAVNLVHDMNPDQRKTAELAIYYNNAVAAGSSISTDIQTLMQNIKCIEDLNDDQLEQVYLLLLCRLGYHEDYPQ